MASVLERLVRFSTVEQVRNWLGMPRVQASTTVDLGSVADGGQSSQSVSVPGAEVGDFVDVALETDLAGLTVTAYVESSDTVAVVFYNGSGGSVDLSETTLRVRVRKQ